MCAEQLKYDRIHEDHLKCDTILESEFNYIAQMVFQNHEDRANTTTFYLAALGSFIAALFGAKDIHGDHINLAFAGVFFLLGLIGYRTLLELGQLRRAWFDSVLAMNTIKQYYLNHLEQNHKLESAFRWTLKTCPHGFQKFSVSSLLAYQTALLASGCFGVGGYFLCRQYADKYDEKWYTVLILIGIGSIIFAALMYHYIWLLRYVEKKWKAEEKKLCQPNRSSST